ncbi:MAG: iron chelate uptake ABC transporter family permease subunit [Opitutales bacterium]
MSESIDVRDPLRGDRIRRQGAFYGLSGTLVITALVSLCVGPLQISLQEMAAAVAARTWQPGLSSASQMIQTVVWEIRLPRIISGMLVGAVLAASGAVMQGLFRNPLADPGLIGVSSGAAVGAVLAIGLGGSAAARKTSSSGSGNAGALQGMTWSAGAKIAKIDETTAGEN